MRPALASPHAPSRNPQGALAAFPPVLLINQPWEWIGPLFEQVREWMETETIRELPGNAALFLIVGGLSILSLIVFLVVLQSLIPTRNPSPGLMDDRPIDRALRAIRPRANLPRPYSGGSLDTGRFEARSARATDLDGVLDQTVLRGIGEPRVLHIDENAIRLRLYGCGSCEPTFGSQRAGLPLECLHERGFFEGAFARIRLKPIVRETECRLRGAAYCEFEVGA